MTNLKETLPRYTISRLFVHGPPCARGRTYSFLFAFRNNAGERVCISVRVCQLVVKLQFDRMFFERINSIEVLDFLNSYLPQWTVYCTDRYSVESLDNNVSRFFYRFTFTHLHLLHVIPRGIVNSARSFSVFDQLRKRSDGRSSCAGRGNVCENPWHTISKLENRLHTRCER